MIFMWSIFSSSEVISIYGRHLNLSRLGKKPSLYSVCRDWVQNDPLGQVMGGTGKQPAVSFMAVCTMIVLLIIIGIYQQLNWEQVLLHISF